MQIGPLVAALAKASLVGQGAMQASDDAQAIRYRATLDLGSATLPFEFEIRDDTLTLINGDERDDGPILSREGDEIVVDMPYFDSRLVATIERPASPDVTSSKWGGEWGTHWRGRWEKRRSSGVVTIPFEAIAGEVPRFPQVEAVVNTVDLSGRWVVDFESSDDDAIGIFEVGADGAAAGTILTTTGDYRYLAGRQSGPRLQLSCFDGAHAFLFDASLDEGVLQGEFRSGTWWRESWTARRDADASLPSGWTMTSSTRVASLESLSYPDLNGEPRTVASYMKDGGLIVKIFGTWCPNCRDAARHMERLHREHGDRVGFVGLAFELTPDHERSVSQVTRFASDTGITYPVLIAGLSDKSKASTAIPVIDRVRSFPTTLFIGPGGDIDAIHTGYSGPATGDAHERLVREYEARLRGMVGER